MITSITSANGNLISLGGSLIDKNTRCRHYNSPLDIIAIKFKCCRVYYPCYQCHIEDSSHSIKKETAQELQSAQYSFTENTSNFNLSKIHNYTSHNPSNQSGKYRDGMPEKVIQCSVGKIHSLERWNQVDLVKEMVILCGSCYHELTFDQYRSNNATCPYCQGNFNPKCSLHYDLYFDLS